MTRDAILQLILSKLDNANEDTPLLGRGAPFDSLGLVMLLADLETELTITLMDENAMSHKHSPFRSVGALADYIYEYLNHRG